MNAHIHASSIFRVLTCIHPSLNSGYHANGAGADQNPAEEEVSGAQQDGGLSVKEELPDQLIVKGEASSQDVHEGAIDISSDDEVLELGASSDITLREVPQDLPRGTSEAAVEEVVDEPEVSSCRRALHTRGMTSLKRRRVAK